jgi:hypothetical protein
MGAELKKGVRMLPPIQSVYNRQVAKCLGDIAEVYDLPSVVVDRIKKAIEFTCKDVDKLRNRNPYGATNGNEENAGNR